MRAKYVAAPTVPAADRTAAATPAAPAARRLFGATQRVDGTQTWSQVQKASIDLPITLPVPPRLAKTVDGA